MSKYEINPSKIEAESYRQIRELTALQGYDREQQQVVMRIVHSLGQPDIARQVRFSQGACTAGQTALAKSMPILCDAEVVRQGLSKRRVSRTPLCFFDDPLVPTLAQSRGETRSMAAVELWRPILKDSIILIGKAPTALYRLIEMLENGAPKPALIIAMPAGFVGAAESKDLLWRKHKSLGIECITIEGREGGAAVTAASCNALLRCNFGEFF